MIGQLIREATTSGARLVAAVDAVGLSIRTYQRWSLSGDGADMRRGSGSDPANKLAPAERSRIIELANSKEFWNLSPKQIVPRLADQGMYVASESTFYRVLRVKGLIKHRETSRPATTRKPKAHAATGPCQLWSWDITYIKSPIAGEFFYLYLFMDVWSRKIVAATVFNGESNELSAKLFVHVKGHVYFPPPGPMLFSTSSFLRKCC